MPGSCQVSQSLLSEAILNGRTDADPFGILEPGQIYIKSSRRLPGVDDIETDVVVGDVLVKFYFLSSFVVFI